MVRMLVTVPEEMHSPVKICLAYFIDNKSILRVIVFCGYEFKIDPQVPGKHFFDNGFRIRIRFPLSPENIESERNGSRLAPEPFFHDYFGVGNGIIPARFERKSAFRPAGEPGHCYHGNCRYQKETVHDGEFFRKEKSDGRYEKTPENRGLSQRFMFL